MKSFVFFVSTLLVLSPMAALAEGCGRGHDSAAMECPEGQTWDSENQVCQIQTS